MHHALSGNLRLLILGRMKFFATLRVWPLSGIADALGEGFHTLLGALADIFTRPGSGFSIWSLLSAFAIAFGFVVAQRRAMGRPVHARAILKYLFPRRLLTSPSAKADMGCFVLNNFAAGTLIGWALLSFGTVCHFARGSLEAAFGPSHAHGISPMSAEIIQTLAMFLAYEFAYWFDHYLSHEIPLLWEFHRVHHTAETLSPVTVFRVHPVDSLVFYNITILVVGCSNAIVGYLTGVPAHDMTIGGSNIIMLAGIFLVVHLQHSHMWIALTGIWGKLFLSPAHHQIHHSTDTAHFGKNLGSTIALWDWLFGTLMVPAKKRQKLTFGVEPGRLDPHTVTGVLVTPFLRGLAIVRRGSSRQGFQSISSSDAH